MNTKYLSLSALLAAVYFVLSIAPIGFPIIGLSSARPIHISEAIPLIYVEIFRLHIGLLATLIGGIILSIYLVQPPFYLLNFIPATTSALIYGLIKENKPIYAYMIYLIMLIIYYFYPVVGPAYLYPSHIWFHIIIFSTLILSSKFWTKINIFLQLLLATLSAQLSGTILFEIIYYPNFLNVETFKYIWLVTSYLYPIERVIIAIIATILIYPVSKLIKRYFGEYLDFIKASL